jgi:hypothetical protein
MATRIFLAMVSLLMREIRRSGVWHVGQMVSIPKTGVVGGSGNHLFAGRGVRGKYTAVEDGMAPWRWHQRRARSN